MLEKINEYKTLVGKSLGKRALERGRSCEGITTCLMTGFDIRSVKPPYVSTTG